MPLHQLHKSFVLKNKQNASQIDPQWMCNSPPIKLQRCEKTSPSRKRCLTLQNQLNQLKIKICDGQFQLKKLEEDCSMKIASIQKQLSKQRTQKKLLIKQCKEKLQEQKHYYQTKLTMVMDQAKKDIVYQQQKTRSQVLEQVQKQRTILAQKHYGQIDALREQLSRIKIQRVSAQGDLSSKWQDSIQSLKRLHQQVIVKIQRSKQEERLQLCQKHRSQISFYLQVEDQRIKEHRAVQKMFSQKIRALQQQLTQLNSKILQLSAQITQKQTQLALNIRQKEQLRLTSISWQRKFNAIQSQLIEKYQRQVSQFKQQSQQKLAQQAAQLRDQLTALKTVHDKTVQGHKSQINLLEDKCLQISLLYSSLKSNEDDLTKIQTLELRLIKKQMEMEKQRQDLKMCKLQLSNMDQIYHKMFEEAKIKSLKTRKLRLPSLMSSGQNRSTMDCYTGMAPSRSKQIKKFSIRQINYQSVSKTKQTGQSNPYE